MSANIGAERVKSVSSQIEALARKNEFSGIESLLSELRDAYKEFSDTFESDVLN